MGGGVGGGVGGGGGGCGGGGCKIFYLSKTHLKLKSSEVVVIPDIQVIVQQNHFTNLPMH